MNLGTESSGENLRSYLVAVTEGMFTLDSDGRLTHLNPSGQRLLGWSEEELVGRVMRDMTQQPASNGSGTRVEADPLLNGRSDGKPIRVSDATFTCKDATEIQVSYTSTPYEITAGVVNSVVIFSDNTERRRKELELQTRQDWLRWLHQIRFALDNKHLVAFAQPIVSLDSGETVMRELLARMRDENGAIVSAARFMPIAEEYGMVSEIDRWMVGKATDLAARGHRVSVNLSVRSVENDGMIEHFQTCLKESGADPSLIVVELTETALAGDQTAAVVFVKAIKAIGFQMALDDFGTGYGGFSYLKQLPVDYLKIDIEFVSDLLHSEPSRNVVHSMVKLAKSFGYRTIAEGVEDEETLRTLVEFGVDMAQGYVISRPAPISEVFAPERDTT